MVQSGKWLLRHMNIELKKRGNLLWYSLLSRTSCAFLLLLIYESTSLFIRHEFCVPRNQSGKMKSQSFQALFSSTMKKKCSFLCCSNEKIALEFAINSSYTNSIGQMVGNGCANKRMKKCEIFFRRFIISQPHAQKLSIQVFSVASHCRRWSSKLIRISTNKCQAKNDAENRNLLPPQNAKRQLSVRLFLVNLIRVFLLLCTWQTA